MMRFSIVGTTIEWDAPSTPTAVSHPSGVNCGSTSSVRPPQIEESIAVAPAIWKNGTETTVLSCKSGSAGFIVFVTYAVISRNVIITPFGSAVVPLVKMRTVGWSSSTSTQMSSAAAPATSPAKSRKPSAGPS